MIRTNQISRGQISLSHNGKPVGQFLRMPLGGWSFVPNPVALYTAPVLREITERLSALGVEGPTLDNPAAPA